MSCGSGRRWVPQRLHGVACLQHDPARLDSEGGISAPAPDDHRPDPRVILALDPAGLLLGGAKEPIAYLDVPLDLDVSPPVRQLRRPPPVPCSDSLAESPSFLILRGTPCAHVVGHVEDCELGLKGEGVEGIERVLPLISLSFVSISSIASFSALFSLILASVSLSASRALCVAP